MRGKRCITATTTAAAVVTSAVGLCGIVATTTAFTNPRTTALCPPQQVVEGKCRLLPWGGGVTSSSSSSSTPTTTTRLALSVTTKNQEAVNGARQPQQPEQQQQQQDGGDGNIYQIANREEYEAFLKAHPRELVVLKFFAPWCRACKGLAPKFMQVANDEKYTSLPVVFAEMSVQHNKDFIKALGVLALPSVHFYAGSSGLVENFPCGPSKVPILRRKLANFINQNVDRETLQLKVDCDDEKMKEAEPCRKLSLQVSGEQAPMETVKVGNVTITTEQWMHLRREIPYFQELTDEQFASVLSKATLQSFDPGSVIMRQGMEGKKFYVIQEGEVEIHVKTAFEDPLTTPGTYLGAVINRFGVGEYFGERALILGEPRAASIRAVEKTRCFTFLQDDFPPTSVLSGKRSPDDVATEELVGKMETKYGVDMYTGLNPLEQQLKNASIANQARGSLNTPELIRGVDTDEDVIVPTDDGVSLDAAATVEAAYLEETPVVADRQRGFIAGMGTQRDEILPLLVRFKHIRQAARCFEYILSTNPKWGDAGEIRRRNMLMSHLTEGERQEFTEVFRVIDQSNDGFISVVELGKVLESIGHDTSTKEVYEMINKANPAVDGNTEISLEDFMGVMAEAEFFHLFKDTFNALDKYNSGFVKASDLDRVLSGMRDLISDDHKSIIDVDDKEMLVNYEQFSKMLLGAQL